MLMISWIKTRFRRRRQNRDRFKADARALASSDPVNAYCNAQRFAARCRYAGERDEFMHWAKVAAEIARIEPRAEMDFAKLKTINDQEEARQGQFQKRRLSK